ncbi:MAG: hypothetical protein ACM3S5_14505 [Rhodospirillales bacterium]
MAALPYPRYGLDKLYLYPYFQTREQYEQITGQPCPPWDKTRRPKKWFAPEAAQSQDDFIVFERVLATEMKESGRPLAGADGKPYLKPLILPCEIAATVNIPPNASNVEGATVPEYPVPLRALDPNEELIFDGPFGIVMVRNIELSQGADTGFTAQDRATLQAIARKLGV